LLVPCREKKKKSPYRERGIQTKMGLPGSGKTKKGREAKKNAANNGVGPRPQNQE